MDIEEIRARIRKMRATGVIPCDPPERIWAGTGGGHRCIGCGDRIASTEVEYEVELPTGITIRLHRICHVVWLEVCAEEVAAPGV
jgi:hypothetical protein